MGCRSRKLNGAIIFMAQYYVRNLREGSRPAPAGYSSWLNYWEEQTRQTAGYCHKNDCLNWATDGAHVQLVDGGNEWYIVPLCHRCNTNYGASFWVDGPLAPVNPDNPIEPYGHVLLNQGALTIQSNNGVTIKNDFEVKKGAVFEIK